MKRYLPILTAVFSLVFVLPSFAQLKSEQEATNIITQPSKSIRGDVIAASFASNLYNPVHAGKAVKTCRGASLLTIGQHGYLVVHLVGDSTGKWYKLDLNNDGSFVGAEFDQISNLNGSTILFDSNLYIYPHLYKQ
jgi:hypothetical protein